MALISAEQGATELGLLVDGLRFVSEADYPLAVVRLALPTGSDARSLLTALGKPLSSTVSQRTLHDFFAQATADQAWHGTTEQATVERFRALVRFLGSALENTNVIRVGTVEIDAYVLGKTADGEWLGVATKQIET